MKTTLVIYLINRENTMYVTKRYTPMIAHRKLVKAVLGKADDTRSNFARICRYKGLLLEVHSGHCNTVTPMKIEPSELTTVRNILTSSCEH